jgi:hypothetical protein
LPDFEPHVRPALLEEMPCTTARKEAILANNSKDARDRAEPSFKKQEQRAREGAKAMADYEAEGRAMREKTARLKSLRMAKEAAGKEAVGENGPK